MKTTQSDRATARFTPHCNLNKEKATMMKPIKKAAHVVATTLMLLVLLPSLAFAQVPASPAPATAPAPGTPAAAASPLFPAQSWEDVAKLYQYVIRYYYVTMQKAYVAQQAQPAVRQIVDEGAGKQDAKDAQFARFENLFKALGFILSAPGEKVPSDVDQAFRAYLTANGCSQGADGKWTGNCMAHYDKVKAEADKAIAAAPEGDFKENAKKLLDTAHQYAYLTVNGQTNPSPETAGDAIILAHGVLAGITPVLDDAHRPWPGLSSKDLLIGKTVCVHEGDEVRCQPVKDVTAEGLVMEDDSTVAWDDADKSAVIGKDLSLDDLHGGGSDRPKYVWAIYGRGFMRGMVGDTPGYDGLVGNHGGMVVARAAVSKYVGVQFGAGACGSTGNPTLGVRDGDSRAGFCGMVGVDTLPLGDSTFGPVVEVSGIWAGKGGGVEAGAGLNVQAGRFFGRALLTGGYLDTNQVPYTHPDMKVPPIKGGFIGGVLGAGVRF